ncbi:sulfate reduction electron transfer complex DsrMKJOP subunit DsrO [Chloroflexota bacterium]
MGTDRRGFIQVAGLAGLGLVIAKPAVDLFSRLNPGVTDGESDPIDFSASPPTGGHGEKRLAMAIDIVKCSEEIAKGTECSDTVKQCQRACHAWHKVPAIPDREEEVKWIWKDTYGRVFEEHLIDYVDEEDEHKKALAVMLLCNQCTNPACIKYCPTRATWKRPDGIVMIDFHRCIGCRYCMAGCPFGSRSFNWRKPRPYVDGNPESDFPNRTKGVVEKCNFCADILEMDHDGNSKPEHTPKCVEACPAGALVFGDLLIEESEISKLLRSGDAHILRRLPELGTKPNNYYLMH